MASAGAGHTAKSIASMTGYGRAQASALGASFVVEVKSVNGRGLDVRLRLAPGFDALETEIRRRLSAAFSRGSISVSLSVEREGNGGRVAVNQQALEAVIEALDWLRPRVEAAPPSLDGILALKGVIEQHEAPISADDEERLHGAVLAAVDEALSRLHASRRDEGTRIAAVLHQRLDEIAVLTAAAERHPGRSRDVVLGRLRQQVSDLASAVGNLSEDRLMQEALLLATKADIREELDRLTTHVAAARQLLATGGAVGRKLDFLSQEFNREANTLCSKSNDVGLTAIGLDMKAAIDQLREQVQNIE